MGNKEQRVKTDRYSSLDTPDLEGKPSPPRPQANYPVTLELDFRAIVPWLIFFTLDQRFSTLHRFSQHS